jgi:CheY-like chemotaxis protein
MTIQPLSGEHRTLVVDDHGISNRYAVAALRQCSGHVLQAQTAREALQIALSWFPDLICMDIQLPDSNGLEVIRRIRRAWPRERLQPRIVIMTGDGSELRQSDLVALKVECLLVKPVSGRQLREATGLHRNTQISEMGSGCHNQEMQDLFRQELQRNLPKLDRCISDLNRDRAAGILHQLIASSAMCHQRKLEAEMRTLNGACHLDSSSADLARAYYSFLEAAHDFLCQAE